MLSAAAAAVHSAALEALRKYPKHPTAQYAYGTAGFRFEIDPKYAPAIFFRAGMVACARAKFLQQTIGLCVTASHNPVKDNGVKIVDPDGGMLAMEWEAIAARAANAPTEAECLKVLSDCLSGKLDAEATVVLGRDTRPHSEMLEKAAIEGVQALGGKAISLGVVTTPQLHYCVMRKNNHGYVPYDATLDGYTSCLVESYKKLVSGTKPAVRPLFVDCANGVGAVHFPSITAKLSSAGLQCSLFNTDINAHQKLNDSCGAEHVQKQRLPPNGLPEGGRRFASFDGDADRIVFYVASQDSFVLLDGDKIAALTALFIQTHFKKLEVAIKQSGLASIGTVQTAYANGSSSAFLKKELGVEVPMVKTGVKYLHHKALYYDVGIYFEANGHGTCLFRKEFIEKLRALRVPDGDATAANAKERLLALAELFNQATGDAMSDLLAVDAMLRVLDMDEEKWNALYHDLPSRQLKVKVVDRSVVVTNEDETRCLRPEALQSALDEASKAVNKGRVFVRPSGTEDVVRVYAEAETQGLADSLADKAVDAIMKEAGGIPDNKKLKSS